jgi:hypothetical protein
LWPATRLAPANVALGAACLGLAGYALLAGLVWARVRAR